MRRRDGRPRALVVGAGFAGSVTARVLADAGWEVVVFDKRDHVGGNAYDDYDENGILVHPYGPHIFHTRSVKILRFLSGFTDWRFYEHRVLASVSGRLVPMPVNRSTLSALTGRDLSTLEAREYLEDVREIREPVRTSEDVVLSSVGRDLCDKLYRGYTLKQWGRDLATLRAGVAARIPVRYGDDDRYFDDIYQMMPEGGYGRLFSTLLDHPMISVALGVSWEDVDDSELCDHVVYTGPVDEFFNFSLGRLGYRSLLFEHVHFESVDYVQPVATINYPNDHLFTRVTEFKHITGQAARGTSVVREYPRGMGDPYYPIPDEENTLLYKKYERLASAMAGMTFVGRLAQYKYLNMDQVVAAGLKAGLGILSRGFEGQVSVGELRGAAERAPIDVGDAVIPTGRWLEP